MAVYDEALELKQGDDVVITYITSLGEELKRSCYIAYVDLIPNEEVWLSVSLVRQWVLDKTGCAQYGGRSIVIRKFQMENSIIKIEKV